MKMKPTLVLVLVLVVIVITNPNFKEVPVTQESANHLEFRTPLDSDNYPSIQIQYEILDDDYNVYGVSGQSIKREDLDRVSVYPMNQWVPDEEQVYEVVITRIIGNTIVRRQYRVYVVRLAPTYYHVKLDGALKQAVGEWLPDILLRIRAAIFEATQRFSDVLLRA